MQCLYESSVYQNVQHRKEGVCSFAARVTAFGAELFPCVAGVAPDGFSRKLALNAAQELDQSSLVLRLERLAAKYGQTVDIARLQQL